MTVTAMGRVNVTSPGTPARLATDPTKKVSKLFFQVIPGLTGKAFVGSPQMNRGSLSGVIRILWPNSSGGFSDQFVVESSDGTNSLPLAEYAVDMDVAGEGLLVSYWTA